MSIVKFECTTREQKLIERIIERAEKMAGKENDIDRLTSTMDLSAINSNGCPLDFRKLLDFPDFDFSHDFWGIRRHINRETGQLEDCFFPRCAR